MPAVTRWGSVAFFSATMVACGHVASTDTGDASTAAVDASTGQAATRACSPLAPPAFLWLEAVTPDGHYLVGTRDPSSTAYSPEVTHLFYGTPDHMAEARVTHTEVGCAWYPSFEADGTSYSAVIAGSCMNEVHSRIYVEGETSPVPMVLTVLVLGGSPTDAGAPASPAAFTYLCF